MKTQRFSLATAAATWAQDGPWSVLYYEEGASVGGELPMIRVRSLQGGGEVDVELKPGRQIRLAKPANGIIVTSLTGAAISGTLSVGNGDIRDSSVMGEVSVVDGAKARTMAGAAFAGRIYQANVAAQFSAAQLWNLGGPETPNVIVSQITALSNSGLWSALIGVTGSGVGTLPTWESNMRSKLAGGAASLNSQLRKQTAVAFPTVDAILGSLGGAAGQSVTYRFTEPIVIPSNYGLTVYISNAANLDLSVNFECIEEAT